MTPMSIREANAWRSLAFPGLIATLALGIAAIGAILFSSESSIDPINGFVERLAGNSSSFLGGLGLLAPLGFAFAAGMASAVNPCGFAILPAYLGLYLGATGRDRGNPQPVWHLGRALLVGGAVTAGFVVLFGIAGLVIDLGARSLFVDILPWLGLLIGVVLAVAGAWMLGGGKLYAAFASRAASHIGDPQEVSIRGFFMFGLSYGLASLSCTLPIFLAVVGTTLTVSNLLTSVGQFFLYALGMGTVIMVLTLGMAYFKGAVIGVLRRAVPYIRPVGSWLMVVAGMYIVFYWLTIGGLL